MIEVHIVMETVDLGGHPVKAYVNGVLAEFEADKLNVAYTAAKMESLIEGGYSKEKAQQWADSYCLGHFYVEIVNLVE